MYLRSVNKNPPPEYVIKLARALDKVIVPINDGHDAVRLDYLRWMSFLSDEDREVIKSAVRAPVRSRLGKGTVLHPGGEIQARSRF
jgi:hypothetical protein